MVDTFYFTWWFWAIIVVALLALEIMAPAFFFLGMAIGAAALALLLMIFGTAIFGGNLAMLVLSFAIISLVATITLRYVFKPSGKQVKTFDHDINR